jgi:type IV pilus assembly protein PilB
VQKGIISDEQLNEALAMQKKYHRHLGDCLVEMGYATEEDIVNVLETQLHTRASTSGASASTRR